MGLCHFPDGVLRHLGHHRLRRHGGAHQVLRLLYLLGGHLPDHLPHFRPLDLGRRLAFAAGLPRFRRFHRGAHGGRPVRFDRRQNPGAPHWQVWQGRQAPGYSGPQYDFRRFGCIHPVVLLVWLQRRLHGGHGYRRADGAGRPGVLQHQHVRRRGLLRRFDFHLGPLQEARRLHDLQRRPGRPGGRYRRLRRGKSRGRLLHWRCLRHCHGAGH